MIKLINFDNCNNVSIDPRVRAVYMRTASELKYCNPSSGHFASEAVRNVIEDARWNVARLINADSAEIVFTSSGTEANNLAVKGAALANFKKGNHIISTGIEHSSVEFPLKTLSRFDFVIDRIEFEECAKVDINSYERLFKKTLMVSAGHACTEAGFTLPVKTLALMAREREVIFHTDACSTAGRVKIDVREMGCDLLSLSAHKFGGAPGAGALFVRRGTRLFPLIEGGLEEKGMRGGAYDVCAIAAMGEAARLASAEIEERAKKTARLRDAIKNDLAAECGESVRWITAGDHLFYHIGLVVAGHNSEIVSSRLAQKGILLSPASWCVTAAGKASPALVMCGLGLEEAQNYLRICVDHLNTEEEASFLVRNLVEIIKGA